jgi:hypothetical protein
MIAGTELLFAFVLGVMFREGLQPFEPSFQVVAVECPEVVALRELSILFEELHGLLFAVDWLENILAVGVR